MPHHCVIIGNENAVWTVAELTFTRMWGCVGYRHFYGSLSERLLSSRREREAERGPGAFAWGGMEF